MAKSRRRRNRNGSAASTKSSFSSIAYNEQDIAETVYSPATDSTLQSGCVHWIKVCGLQNRDDLAGLAGRFNIHHLIMEDVVNTHQRPKVEDYDHQLFIVLRLFRYENSELDSTQISFVAMDDCLLSFEETEVSVFGDVVSRLHNRQGTIRKRGEDYLLYALMDVIIDRCLDVEDKMGDELDDLEDAILENPVKDNFLRLQQMRRNIIALRKNLLPLREVIQSLMRNKVDFFDEENKVYLRDLDDHILRAIDTLDTFRDIAASMNDLYHSLLNNKLNVVMKTLTVISSIFIPLTFIVGIYGMNFDNMPELRWPYGYFGVMLFMLLLAIAQLIYFRSKKWF